MPDDSRRKNELVASMTARLRPVCSEWPADYFAQMVSHLADITLKYENEAIGRTGLPRNTPAAPRTRSPE
jgi:hypothetical protein